MQRTTLLIALATAAGAAMAALMLNKAPVPAPGQAFQIPGFGGPDLRGPEAPIQKQNPVPVGTKTPATLEAAAARGLDLASFGGGCFWCVEDDFRRTKGVTASEVGYQGGRTASPTYETLKGSGHVEVARFAFDPKVISYRTMVQRFFAIHNPTQGNQEGPDVGEQYRSVVFVHSPQQRKIAQEVLNEVQKTLPVKITTTIEDAPRFWRAEEYHQQYYQKKGFGG